jgi:hypothetical protein
MGYSLPVGIGIHCSLASRQDSGYLLTELIHEGVLVFSRVGQAQL